MDVSTSKIKSAVLLITFLISAWGCASLQEHSQDKPAGKLPEQIHVQPKTNYFNTSRVMIFPFEAPKNYSSVGASAANMLAMKLINSKIFYSVIFKPETVNQKLETLFQIAEQEEYDIIITGRILNYLSGTTYQNSRVDEEIKIYNVKTKKVLWHASAAEVGKPVQERDYYIFQTEGKESPSATALLAENTDKFVRMLQWTSPQFSALTEEMKLVDLGYNHMEAQNTEKAKHYFNQVLKVNPENPYALLDLGVIFEREGNVAAAAAMYQRVINLNPDDIVTESSRPSGLDRTLSEVARDNMNRLGAAAETMPEKE